MVKEENFNKDFWKAISNHYEKDCYEDALRDACLYLIELIQEKSENYDMDGEKLINNVFSEKNPKLLINKYQTPSEIDEQRGYGFIVRGLIVAIRNPLSHDKKIQYSKDVVDSILVFINNYILPKLDDTKEFGYVDNWFEFIFLNNNNDSEKFSDKVLDNLSKKDRVNLMKEIVLNLEKIKSSKYFYFINKLYDTLTIKSKNEIIVMLNRKLIKASDDNYLKSFFDHFDFKMWKELDSLVTVRIEEMATKSIEQGKIIYSGDFDEYISDEGRLATWVSEWIEYFSNCDEIKKVLLKKLEYKEDADFVFRYFKQNIINEDFLLKFSSEILDGLKNEKYYFRQLIDKSFKAYSKDSKLKIFASDYDRIKDLKLAPVEDFLS